MRRAITVVLLAILTTVVSGVREPSWALQTDASGAADRRVQKVAARVAKIPRGAVVKVDRRGGPDMRGVLDEVTADAVVIIVLAGPSSRRETIAFADIEKISEVKGHALRNVAIGVGVGFAVLVGACAVAATHADRTPVTTPAADAPVQ